MMDSELNLQEALDRARQMGDSSPGDGALRLLWRLADLFSNTIGDLTDRIEELSERFAKIAEKGEQIVERSDDLEENMWSIESKINLQKEE